MAAVLPFFRKRTPHVTRLVIQVMLRGEIPEDVRSWLCGASLMGCLRQASVGETLRGLGSKVAIELVGSSVQSILEPFRSKLGGVVGVGLENSSGPNGPRPIAVILTETCCSSTRPTLLIASLGRRFFWRHPHGRLRVHQGDPLGPSLFALGIHLCTMEALTSRPSSERRCHRW